MTLGQFAVAVGASKRWVLNAMARLEPPRSYSEPVARRLALARLIAAHVRMPLPDAYALAGRVLAEVDVNGTWILESSEGAVTLAVNMPRFFTKYGAQLALARTHYGEKLRGRRSRRRKSAVARAKEYGIDVTLLDSALRRTPSERLKLLDENMEFVRKIRGIAAR